MIIYQNGYFRNWDYCDKHISNLRNKQVVEYRLSVLKFWEKHGLTAALEYATALHPKHKCSKATLYRWRKALKDPGKRDRMGRCSLSALDPKSTRPKHFRRAGDYTELYEPIKQMLDEHYFLGRHKVYYSLIGKQKKGERFIFTIMLNNRAGMARWKDLTAPYKKNGCVIQMLPFLLLKTVHDSPPRKNVV